MDSADVVGVGEIRITWSVVDDGGAVVLGYNVESSTSSSGPWTSNGFIESTTREYTATGLTIGTEYFFRVNVVNEEGTGPFSDTISEVAAGVPTAPQQFVVTPVDGGVDVDWNAPTSDGGSPIVEYQIEYGPSATGPWSQTFELIRDLENGTQYFFRVAARNAAGVGAFSTVVPATPRTVPSEPMNFHVEPRYRGAFVWWTTPVSDGGSPLTGYAVFGSPSLFEPPVELGRVGPSTRQFDVTGLTPHEPYYISVRAINAAGVGADAGPTEVTPWDLASAPRNLRVAQGPGSGAATLTWTAPLSDGGAPITGYQVLRYSSAIGRWVAIGTTSSTTFSYTATGLANGTTYYLRVVAYGPAGQGAMTNTVSVKPIPLPSAPQTPRALPGPNRVTLTWAAPSAPGGPLTGYTVFRYNASSRQWMAIGQTDAATRSFTATGLTNGTTYYFAIAAKNAAGRGSPSATVSAVPRTTPSAPRSLVASPGSNRVTLSWQPPSSTGGAEISSYVIYRSTSPTSGWTYTGTTRSSTRTFVASGLANGTRYYFRVLATNVAGWGPASTPVNAVPSSIAGSGVYFANCTDVHLAGWPYLRSGQPGYRLALDRDRDGYACE